MITVCSNSITHPIKVRCEEYLEAQGQWLVQTISKLLGQNRSLIEDNKSVQVGWSVLKLVLQPDNSFIVFEPDFSSNPFIEFRPEVSTTLKVLLAQNDFLFKTGLQGLPVSFEQKIVLHKGVLNESRIIAQRQYPTEQDSGWYISQVEPATTITLENLEAIFLYQLLALRPELVQVLCLPPGSIVILNGSEIEAVVSDEDQIIWPTNT
jgi:hypothetical protein